MDIQKDRSRIPCYWEKMPGGCTKPHCAFLHGSQEAEAHSTFSTQQKKGTVCENKENSDQSKLVVEALDASLDNYWQIVSDKPQVNPKPKIAPVVFNPWEEGSDQEMYSPEKKVEKKIDQLERQTALSEAVRPAPDIRQILPAQTEVKSNILSRLGRKRAGSDTLKDSSGPSEEKIPKELGQKAATNNRLKVTKNVPEQSKAPKNSDSGLTMKTKREIYVPPAKRSTSPVKPPVKSQSTSHLKECENKSTPAILSGTSEIVVKSFDEIMREKRKRLALEKAAAKTNTSTQNKETKQTANSAAKRQPISLKKKVSVTLAASSSAKTVSAAVSSEVSAPKQTASEGASLKATVLDGAISGKSAVKGGNPQVSKSESAISKKTVCSGLKTKVSTEITTKGSKQPGEASKRVESSVSVRKVTGASPKGVESSGGVSRKESVEDSSKKLTEVPSTELTTKEAVMVEKSDKGLDIPQDKSDEHKADNDRISVASSKSQPDDVTKRKPSFETQRSKDSRLSLGSVGDDLDLFLLEDGDVKDVDHSEDILEKIEMLLQ
ncbi:zinc finger CCCH domain-containing protein 11A-like isoform X2 [Liolophura sinensis]|uniref:zinc finger CCCH domain-containing protein 11A-like isoform X2 n=1 Tax=Liolophura sinensis TaxID=3198878 RepID=UPI003159006E